MGEERARKGEREGERENARALSSRFCDGATAQHKTHFAHSSTLSSPRSHTVHTQNFPQRAPIAGWDTSFSVHCGVAGGRRAVCSSPEGEWDRTPWMSDGNSQFH